MKQEKVVGFVGREMGGEWAGRIDGTIWEWPQIPTLTKQSVGPHFLFLPSATCSFEAD